MKKENILWREKYLSLSLCLFSGRRKPLEKSSQRTSLLSSLCEGKMIWKYLIMRERKEVYLKSSVLDGTGQGQDWTPAVHCCGLSVGVLRQTGYACSAMRGISICNILAMWHLIHCLRSLMVVQACARHAPYLVLAVPKHGRALSPILSFSLLSVSPYPIPPVPRWLPSPPLPTAHHLPPTMHCPVADLTRLTSLLPLPVPNLHGGMVLVCDLLLCLPVCFTVCCVVPSVGQAWWRAPCPSPARTLLCLLTYHQSAAILCEDKPLYVYAMPAMARADI